MVQLEGKKGEFSLMALNW